MMVSFQSMIYFMLLIALMNLLFLMLMTKNNDDQHSEEEKAKKVFQGEIIKQRNIAHLNYLPPLAPGHNSTESTNYKLVWLATDYTGHLKLIKRVFERLGYEVTTGLKWNNSKPWNILWSNMHPFKTLASSLTSLSSNQRINHFPGTGFVVNKVTLATSDIKNIPKAFKLPDDKYDLLKYSKQNPDQLFVEKGNRHNGVKIKALSEIDMTSSKSFVQRFIDRPFLIDGYRFDIGIYTAVTSVNPLRLYVFSDWHVRFCPEQYYPFDANNTRKYVIESSTYIGPWDIPTVNAYFSGEDTTRKDALLMALKDQGVDTDRLESELIDTIRKVYLTKEKKIADYVSKYPHQRSFFELVRSDFLLDENLNVYLMEVNMSPSLNPGKNTQHTIMYEQVVFDFMNLVGIAVPTSKDFLQSTKESQDMQVSSKNIRVYLDKCSSDVCSNTCEPDVCKFCESCLQGGEDYTLMQAYNEHVGRRGFKRIFPEPYESVHAAQMWNNTDDESYSSLNVANQWMTIWFHGKCIKDSHWCA